MLISKWKVCFEQAIFVYSEWGYRSKSGISFRSFYVFKYGERHQYLIGQRLLASLLVFIYLRHAWDMWLHETDLLLFASHIQSEALLFVIWTLDLATITNTCIFSSTTTTVAKSTVNILVPNNYPWLNFVMNKISHKSS